MARSRKDAPKTAEECAGEAIEYYRNARETLRAAGIRDGVYGNVKKVREACGTAYLAVLAAIRGFLLAQGARSDKLPESYDAYCQFLARYSARNGKVKKEFTLAYHALHLDGYYRGFSTVDFAKTAFAHARFLIERLTGRKVAEA